MADRVTVTEPYTGVEMSVRADSPQARAWGKPEPKRAPRKEPAKSDKK